MEHEVQALDRMVEAWKTGQHEFPGALPPRGW
jgi:hypothetical protein